MYDKKHFDQVLASTNLAFSKAPTKGIIFWYNAALPDSEENNKENEVAWNSLRATFVKNKPDQADFVEKVIQDLKYIREQALKYEAAREKLEELKNFLVQTMAFEDVSDSLREYVLTNYDTIKAGLKQGE